MLRVSSKRFRFVGTPEMIADRIQEYADVGINGFNIINILLLGTYIDFVEQVAPVLQQRGLMQSAYRKGTLREKLFPGQGPYLAADHPGYAYRHHG